MKKRPVQSIAALCLLLAVCLLPLNTLMAQTTNWTGGSGNAWNNAGNWDNGVPTATLNVVIPGTAPVQPIISTTAEAKSVHVQTAASLSISSAGSLTINSFTTLGGFPNALYNEGTITNDGKLIMGNLAPIGQIGVRNSGTFTNRGTLTIDQVTNEALINGSTFVNTGTFTIGSVATVGGNALWNQGSFSNSAGGRIAIDRAGGSALRNTGNSFVNSATITIGASASVGGTGITNAASSTITNSIGALIQIDKTGSTAIRTEGIFANSADIRIGSLGRVAGQGIYNGGSFTNSIGALIQIDNTGSQGVFTVDIFANNADIRIGSLGTVGGRGIYNTRLFTNASGGNISINRTLRSFDGDGIFNGESATFVNASALTIGDVAFEGEEDIYNLGSFTNTTTGIIRLDRALSYGIRSLNSLLINDGKLIIGSVTNMEAVGIVSVGTMVNSAGAEIHVDRVRLGIINGKVFTNAGLMRIGAVVPPVEQAIQNVNVNVPFAEQAIFTNQACGIIEVFAPVSHQDGTFTNDGLMTVTSARVYSEPVVRINAPAGLVGKYAYAGARFGPSLTTINLTADVVLVNDGSGSPTQGCNPPVNAAQLAGKVALIDRGTCNFSQKVYYAQQAGAVAAVILNNQAGEPMMMATGPFGDQVTIPSVMLSQADGVAIKAALNNGPVTISISQELPVSATLINNGVLSYPQGNLIANVVNNDLIIPQVTSCSAVYANALQIGGSNSFSVGTTWYRDAALTQPAGTYNSATNTFTANNLPAGVTILYASVTDNVNMCTRTVAVGVNQQQPGSASIQSLVAATSACPYRIQAVATGSSFVFTGPGEGVSGQTTPDGYVFSTVYRNPGTYSVESLNVKQPGTYTLTVTSANSCGTGTTSQSVTISASRCP